MSDTAFETVTITPVDVVALPAASRATAVIVWLAFVKLAVFKLTEYAEVVSSTPPERRRRRSPRSP